MIPQSGPTAQYHISGHSGKDRAIQVQNPPVSETFLRVLRYKERVRRVPHRSQRPDVLHLAFQLLRAGSSSSVVMYSSSQVYRSLSPAGAPDPAGPWCCTNDPTGHPSGSSPSIGAKYWGGAGTAYPPSRLRLCRLIGSSLARIFCVSSVRVIDFHWISIPMAFQYSVTSSVIGPLGVSLS